MEPLQNLRECVIANMVPTIAATDESVTLKGTEYALDTKTAWAKTGGTEFYDLKTLIVFLELVNDSVPVYIRGATQRKTKFVSNVDREELLKYLRGEIDTADNIQSAAIQPDNRAAIGAHSSSSSAPQSSDAPSAKRSRLNDSSSASRRSSGSEAAGLSSSASTLTDDQLRDAKQRHAERLGQRRGSTGGGRAAGLILGTGSSSAGGAARSGAGASELGMSSDKLLELRTKRLAQKRSTFSLEGHSGDALEDDEDAPIDPVFLEADREIVARLRAKEVRVSDRNAVLRRPGKDFKFALDYHLDVRRREKERDAASAAKDSSKSRGRRGDAAAPLGRTPDKPLEAPPSGPPIIIVPSVQSAILTLYNAKSFLEGGVFVPNAEAVKAAAAERKPTELLIERSLPSGKQVIYKLVDNPTRLRVKEWDNVVCVVVQGAAWQFKGWHYEQPVKLFHFALGVHFKYDDVRLDPKVGNWNVKVLEINKYKRYQDKGASLDFWRMLDEFMKVNKPRMMVQLA